MIRQVRLTLTLCSATMVAGALQMSPAMSAGMTGMMAQGAAVAAADHQSDLIRIAAKKGEKKSKEAAGQDDAASSGEATQAIIALVNDEPITGFEVQQRQRLAGLGANVQDKVQSTFQAMIKAPSTTEKLKAILAEVISANEGKSKDDIIAIFEGRKKQFAVSLQKQAVEQARRATLPGLRKAAIDELIDEKLKLQEAKRLNAIADESEVTRIITGMAGRNKMNEAQFGDHLNSLGVDISAMRARIKASLSWNDVIRRRFGQQITVSGRDVDRLVASGPAGEDSVQLKVHRISLALPGKLGQAEVAERLQQADQLRLKFAGCNTMQTLAASAPGGKYEDLGERKPSSIPEPTRTLLLSAGDGEMLPPSLGDGNVELWAVCGRTTVKADEEKRQAAEGELKQKEFELIGKRYLKDLRQDASIEYRGS